MKKPTLSIVVLSYNTKDLLRSCLDSLDVVKDEVAFEIIVPDNGSTDGSPEMIEEEYKSVRLVRNEKNLGFAAGNNKARECCSGEYVLFLNSDTEVYKDTLRQSINYLKVHKDVGALTCKLILPSGKLDPDTRRSFITPWIGLVHIFLKLDRLFPKSKFIAKYWYSYLSEDQVHEVDVIQGAYFLVRKNVLDQVNWFDEDYFLDGEDVDLCWRIKEKGWKIMYYPKVSILHVKGASKGKNKNFNKVPFTDKLKYRIGGINSMELFLRKRLWVKYPLFLNIFMLLGMNILKLIRIVKLIIFG